MTLGTEWLIEASGCDAAALADLDRLRAVFNRVIRGLELNVLGEIQWQVLKEASIVVIDLHCALP